MAPSRSRIYVDPAGRGSPVTFLADWQRARAAIDGRGHLILPSSNHDFSRLAAGRREVAALKAAFALLLTWPSIPAIYYGDEIGMRFIHDFPDVEGSRLGPLYNRGFPDSDAMGPHGQCRVLHRRTGVLVPSA